MESDLTEKGYIPLDKSWMIRMGVLDLVKGYSDSYDFLKKHYDELGDDLRALYHASVQWNSGDVVNVGESATLYRFLKFASWKLNAKKVFVTQGTLRKRKIHDNPEIANWPLEKLLILDNNTSQWASASVLLGNPQRLPDSAFKLGVTYDAVEHWNAARARGECWKPRYDKTILAQAMAYLQWLKTGNTGFKPEQAEDYCFARAFDVPITEKQLADWKSLRGHESDRISEMEKALLQPDITSDDHRVVQAIAMLRKGAAKVTNPGCVNKSWPQFWNFLGYCLKNNFVST